MNWLLVFKLKLCFFAYPDAYSVELETFQLNMSINENFQSFSNFSRVIQRHWFGCNNNGVLMKKTK